ncbi:MAG: hypothetical protein IJ736_10050 [Firmicutes bacterium]|nr:hypothetical protein [Bacillota bacterium]
MNDEKRRSAGKRINNNEKTGRTSLIMDKRTNAASEGEEKRNSAKRKNNKKRAPKKEKTSLFAAFWGSLSEGGSSRKKVSDKRKKGKPNNKPASEEKRDTSSLKNPRSGESGNVYEFEKRRRKSPKVERRTRVAIGTGKITNNVAVLMFVIIIVYLCVKGYGLMTKDIVVYDTIEYGSIDTAKVATGVITRNEKVYKASAAGMISYNIADEEKVKPGMTVCTIKDSNITDSMEDTLDDIEKNIYDMSKLREGMSVFSEDVEKLNNQIKNTLDTYAYAFSINDIKSFYTAKNMVESKISLRNKMILSENKGSLEELSQQQKETVDEINANTTPISAESGGILIYNTDGLEETFTRENLDKLTKEQTQMQAEISNIKTSVMPDDNIFKIIEDNVWYISSYIPDEYIEGWEEGDMRKIYIKNANDTEMFEAYVQKLVKNDDDDEAYVVLKMTKDILEYIDTRNFEFELNKTEEGFKVVISAIVEKVAVNIPSKYVRGGKVLRKKGNEVSEIVVTTLDDEEVAKRDFIYPQVDISVLSVGDTLIGHDDPNDTYVISDDVKNQKGVYVINSGIAEFKAINMENSISNSTHTILDKNNNFDIKIYDRIISDAKNVDKQQFLYK